MRPYFADTVLYESSGGHRYHGSSEGLLKIAGSDFDKLDSMRFDIFTWQSVHVNDKNEDWVYIWGAERQYGKDGTADTSLIHEQWKIENHKVTYFNQFNAKPAH